MTSETRILVYQPGKVGSTAVFQALNASGLGMRVDSAHVLSARSMRQHEEWNRQAGVREMPAYLATGARLADEIGRNTHINWKIITIFREPVARMVSGFFQEASRVHPTNFPENGDWDYPTVERFLLREFHEFTPEDDYTSRWFDWELKAVFGIDVYDYPFDHEPGFISISRGNFDVLAIRYEQLASAFAASISKFLAIDEPISLPRSNDSNDKPYYQAYQHALEHFRLPSQVCREIYSTRFAVHFFPQSVRQALIERWGR